MQSQVGTCVGSRDRIAKQLCLIRRKDIEVSEGWSEGKGMRKHLGRERGAVHRPVFCKRARVIKMSARDIFLAGDPLWALASPFSPVAGSLSRVRVSPAALAQALIPPDAQRS